MQVWGRQQKKAKQFRFQIEYGRLNTHSGRMETRKAIEALDREASELNNPKNRLSAIVMRD